MKVGDKVQRLEDWEHPTNPITKGIYTIRYISSNGSWVRVEEILGSYDYDITKFKLLREQDYKIY